MRFSANNYIMKYQILCTCVKLPGEKLRIQYISIATVKYDNEIYGMFCSQLIIDHI